MTQHEIVALRCPSCGSGITEPSRDKPFGAEFRCDGCGITSVLIVDQALVPLSTLQKLGEKVCAACGRIAGREARFCQGGHELVKSCFYCRKEFAVDHQRCDFCGREYPALQLHEVHKGTVRRIEDSYALLEILSGIPVNLHESEANHPFNSIYSEVKIDEQIEVKIIRIAEGVISVSSKLVGRP